MGGRTVLRRRALHAKVDLDDLHDAHASRLRSSGHQPAGAKGVWTPARWRVPARWWYQLRHLGKVDPPQRDVRHGDGPFYSFVLSTISKPSMPRATSASPRLSNLSGIASALTAVGPCRTATRARRTSSWNASVHPAVGTLSALCGCSSGGSRA